MCCCWRRDCDLRLSQKCRVRTRCIWGHGASVSPVLDEDWAGYKVRKRELQSPMWWMKTGLGYKDMELLFPRCWMKTELDTRSGRGNVGLLYGG
ncbi:uncharacterized protein LOC134928644 [Pseudophryne corroboree]|uniref:uncharacterized protein LOC134928644 n=1 Tax=Pseudophryne corroboree TaxID=495146 RepID=UPI003081D861